MTDTCPTCGAAVERAEMEPLEDHTFVTTLRPCGHTVIEDV